MDTGPVRVAFRGVSGERSSRPPRAPGAYLRLPLWQRFALALLIGVGLLVALILYVSTHNTDSNTSTNIAAAVQANRDAEILVAQDQAPHTAHLRSGMPAATALGNAIHARMAKLVTGGAIDGPLRTAQCRPAGPGSPSRQAFRCRIVAGGVAYPYLGVVQTRAGTITFCKRDAPPVASDDIPVSRRCR